MGTQGVVSVVTGKNVHLKASCGQDGYNANKLVAKILAYYEEYKDCPSAEKVYSLALHVTFGHEEDLVVLDGSGPPICDEEDAELHPRYFETFDDPWFNPRWDSGTASYTRVIDFAYKPPRVMEEKPKPSGPVVTLSAVKTFEPPRTVQGIEICKENVIELRQVLPNRIDFLYDGAGRLAEAKVKLEHDDEIIRMMPGDWLLINNDNVIPVAGFPEGYRLIDTPGEK